MDIRRQVENRSDDASAQNTERALEPKSAHNLKTESGETILGKQSVHKLKLHWMIKCGKLHSFERRKHTFQAKCFEC